jgi:hypothetical protein
MNSTAHRPIGFATRILVLLVGISCELRAIAPEDIRPPEDLMYVFEMPPLYGTKDQDDAFWAEQRKRILETPDITNRLYDLLWITVEAGRIDLFQMIFSALRIKADLTPDQVRRITDKMREEATPDATGKNHTKQWFVESAVGMLSAYPSPDHEDLLLSILEKGDEGWSRAAARSLGHIGTRRSIEPVRKLVESQAKRVDPKMVAEMTARYGTLKGDPLVTTLSNLERRVAISERKSTRDNLRDERDFESKDGISNPADSKSPGKQMKPIWAIIVSALMIGVGIYYFLRRRHSV